MKAYESGQASYFATPPVNLVYAFHASLTTITKSQPSLEERFKIHKDASAKLKAAAAEAPCDAGGGTEMKGKLGSTNARASSVVLNCAKPNPLD